ncbi:MAG TPA: dihydrolipoyllysine-residue acetyltransferase [Nitrosomonas sp.]|nr:dihydrolipoyllysine-residue acetyltransferase [Nitrosomonas sp.]HMW19386.1 dihydrolipoyllysine-residue acetyltransferase [Nitrosomonas sp.]HMW68564.1 dihydrolipoyllysine-residue acetyltransferase [Nitrosomonas sp.]HMY61719.1 dihydrolipoyllysine-residue acetyltransferase [Nitrosomonas sp.]HMY89907.1 dihydrolipoyllysine-residue acetyltransferase [Nitrosomonas sp.]
MGQVKKVLVPDIGDFKEVPVIEVLIHEGERLSIDDALITLESDKASIEVPSPYAGIVNTIHVKVGDKVSEGAEIITMEVSDAEEKSSTTIQAEAVSDSPAASNVKQSIAKEIPVAAVEQSEAKSPAQQPSQLSNRSWNANPDITPHAGPSVRRFARELGVDLTRVIGSGPKHRILKEDILAYVKHQLSKPTSSGERGYLDLLPWPHVDFAKFGPIELKTLSRIKQISGANLHRNWVMIPHVTQFDEADITELESLRKEYNESQSANGIKLTILAFLIKATTAALKKFPEFNASLDNSNSEANLVLKRYYHLGFAVDTPNGLVVPVIRDADQKGVITIAEELGKLSTLARDGKLKPTDMQGASFTISSLGGIGGTAFTPIINAPEVAILGVSKASLKPVYRNGEFVPRLVVPLSLSYDHRVIDGASAARFTSHLSNILADMRLALF